MEVTATKQARNYVSKHGSAVYVWAGSAQFVQTAVEQPEGVDFDRFDVDDIAVFVESGLPMDMGRSLTIRRDVLPPWRLTATWSSMAWAG